MSISMLLLSREKIPTNRAVIRDLWCRVLPSKGIRIIWIAETKCEGKRELIKCGNLSIFIFGFFKNRSIITQTLKSSVKKFRIANFLLREEKINQLQVRNGITDGMICFILSLRYNVPYSFHLSSLHGFEDYDLSQSQKGWQSSKLKLRAIIYPIFYIIIMKRASLVQPISDYMGNYLEEKGFVDPTKIFPLPVSATIREISNTQSKQLSKNPSIIYTGSLGAERDLGFIFKLFKLVLLDNPDVRLRIVGIVEKGTSKKSLYQMLDNYKIRKSTDIFFNISPSKVSNHLNASDIGISAINPIPKYIVSTPTKMVEYLSYGLPVVCNNEILDQKNVIDKSKAGFAVPYSVKSFYKSVVSLLNDKELYSEMSKKGRDWIRENRTYDDLAPLLIEKYTSFSN